MKEKFIVVILPLILFIIGLLIIFFFTLKGTVIFDIDIARDLLLISEIVNKKNPTLIGARTAIDGVFHGPLWLYLNLPAFLIGKGNPEVIAWFWLVIFIGMLISVYFIAKKLFDKKIAILSLTLITSSIICFTKSPTNPFVAVLIFPIFFYFIFIYFKKSKIIALVSALFLAGLLIQGEMVFGIPILIFALILVFYKIFKTRKFSHFFAIPLVLIPLSSFILFELTHKFMQINSLLKYLSSSRSQINLGRIVDRFLGTIGGIRLFVSSPHEFEKIEFYLNLLPIISIIFLVMKFKEKYKYRLPVLLFVYFYLGFWLMLFFISTTIHWYYYWPFLGIGAVLMAVAAFENKIIYFLVIGGIIYNLINGVSYFNKKNTIRSFWLGQKEYAFDLFKNAPLKFGYLINTFDQINNYIPMYTMIFTAKSFPEKNATPFDKEKMSYVIAGPYPDGKPMDNSWWVINKLHISSKPVKHQIFPNGYTIELYSLTDEEIKIQVEPIFDSLQYR